MPRIWLITPVIVLVAAASQGQHGGAGHGAHAGASSPHISGVGGRSPLRSLRSGTSPSRRRNEFPRGNRGYGYGNYPYLFPDYEPSEEIDNGQQANEPAAVNDHRGFPGPQERPIPKAQVIEIPGAASLASAKPMPETVFVLTNGEKVETHRFMLTANTLSLTVQRQQRTIPIEMLDYDATLAANRDRGIDLRIPNDRNEISLRF